MSIKEDAKNIGNIESHVEEISNNLGYSSAVHVGRCSAKRGLGNALIDFGYWADTKMELVVRPLVHIQVVLKGEFYFCELKLGSIKEGVSV